MSYLVPKIQSVKQALPNVLFYKRKVHNNVHPKQIEFAAFSTKNLSCYGELLLHKSKIQHRIDYAGPTLAIDFIKSSEKDCGLGTEMINFAKNYSKQHGCNGYIVLVADSTIAPEKVPHVFYRKQGFSTLKKQTDKKLDVFVKNHSYATKKDFSREIMHFPPKNKTKKINYSFLEKVKDIIRKFRVDLYI